MKSLPDIRFLEQAIALSLDAPASPAAFSVGCVIAANDRILATGTSREFGPHWHAEEVALAKAAGSPELAVATLYSSMEPCSVRRSRPKPCAELIIEAGIRRVVFALREPPTFVHGDGANLLSSNGVETIEVSSLADRVRAVNAHLIGPS